jgi:hypothetical protein
MERIVERRIEGELIHSYRIAWTYIGMGQPTKGARTTHLRRTRENLAPGTECPSSDTRVS